MQPRKTTCSTDTQCIYPVSKSDYYLVYSALIEPNPLGFLAEDLHEDLVSPPHSDVGITEPPLLQVLLETGVLDNVALLEGGEWMCAQLAQGDAWREGDEKGIR